MSARAVACYIGAGVIAVLCAVNTWIKVGEGEFLVAASAGLVGLAVAVALGRIGASIDSRRS